MSQLLTINLSKGPGVSWGFRLQGGKDFAQPLCIQKVNVGSVAEAAGLQAGDAIVSIGGSDALALRHKEAQDTIVRAGNSFPMVVQRGAMTWKPQVTPLAQAKKTPQGPVATQTSLAAAGQPTKRAPKGFNAVPAGFGEVNGQPVVNPQYNSPINLYNEDAVAEALSAQSEVLGKGCLGINFRKFDREVTLRTDSPTYMMIHGDESAAGAAKPRKQLPAQEAAPQQPKPVFPAPQPGQQGPGSGVSSPVPGAGPTRSVQAPVTRPRAEGGPQPAGGATVCSQCEKPIIGVFVRIKDKNLHADCFKCNTCGSSLKNVGYYNINEKLYCDVHAKQAAKVNPPGPNMVPVTVKPGGAPPAGAFPAAAAKAPFAAPAQQQPEPTQPAPPAPEPAAAPAPPPAAAAPASPPPTEALPEVESPMVEEAAAVVHEAVPAPQEDAAPQVEEQAAAPVQEEAPAEVEPVAESTEQPAADVEQAPVSEKAAPEPQAAEEPAAAVAEGPAVEEPVVAVEEQITEATPAEQPQPAPEAPEAVVEAPEAPEAVAEAPEALAEAPEAVTEAPEPAQQAPVETEPEPEVALELEPEPEIVLAPEPEPEILEAPAAAPAGFTQEEPVASVTFQQPAPTFAPAPIPTQPSVAPGGSSANPSGFGAPSGGVNVRSHIPKKAARFVWPPRRAASEEGTHSPSWAPAGEVLKVPMPVHVSGPLPKTIPLLPTPPPPKDYESMVMSTVNVDELQRMQQQQQQQVSQVVKTSSSATQKKTVVETTYESKSSVSVSASSSSVSASTKSSSVPVTGGSSAGKSVMKGKISPPKPVPVTAAMPTVNFGPSVSLPVSSKPTAPPAPAPSSVPEPQSALLPGGLKKSASVPGVKPVKAPVTAVKKSDSSSFGFKPVKPKFGAQEKPGSSTPAPAPAPAVPAARTPIDPSTLPFAVAPLPFGSPLPELAPAPAAPKKVAPLPTAKPAPKPAPKPSPKPASPQPPKPTGPAAPAPVAAPTFAPAPVFAPPKPVVAPVAAPVFNKPLAAPAPAPAPAPMFGGGSMPKPAPPPGMGGLAKPPGMGGPPTKGIPGERTAPKRGRGVMNPAQASRIPVCANCQRQIRGPFVTALGKNWCPDHFHCATDSCRKQLIDVGFVEEQGSLYCEDCYEKFLAPTCGKCDKRIKGDCLNAVGKQFHPECFACAYCGKVFGSGAFYLEDGLPYCETDWNDLFTTKCVGCGFPIEAGDRWVEALNNNYHSQCFKCSKCHKNLEGQSFFAKGGKPFCKAHAQRGF